MRPADPSASRGVQDVRAADRSLRTWPGSTLLVIAMLSLGIGLNGAVFTLVHAALFKGYPLVHDHHRSARLSTSRGAIFYPDFLEWRARSRQFADMALTRGSFHTVAMPDRQVETVFAAEVTPNMFGLLRVAPFRGRDPHRGLLRASPSFAHRHRRQCDTRDRSRRS